MTPEEIKWLATEIIERYESGLLGLAMSANDDGTKYDVMENVLTELLGEKNDNEVVRCPFCKETCKYSDSLTYDDSGELCHSSCRQFNRQQKKEGDE